MATSIEQAKFIEVYRNGKAVRETTEFAVGVLNTKLTLQQKRIFYWVFSMVAADEEIDALYKYNISINDMAALMNTDPSTLKRNMAQVVSHMDILNLNYDPPMLANTPDGRLVEKSFGIFDQVWIDKYDPDTIKIILTTGFRRKVIMMKKRFDLEFPLRTIMQMSSVHAIDLYTLLMSEAAMQRDNTLSNGELIDSFVITIGKDKLFGYLNFTGRTSDFNNITLPVIIKNLKNSEILLDANDPVIERKGNRIISYTFHVRVHTTIENRIFAKSALDYSVENGMPKLDYLLDKLRKMGVGEALVKKCRAQNDRARIWGNYLYTLYCVGKKPAYFNSAYNNQYFEEVTGGNPELMFRVFIEEPGCHKYWKDDELMCQLKDYNVYKDGSFFDDLRKKIALAEEKRNIS